MKGNRGAIAAVLAVVLLAVGWWLFRRGSAGDAIDLVAEFGDTVKQPNAGMFAVRDADLAGESKQAIAIEPTAGTRLTWKLRVPDDAWLRLSVGLAPESWEQEGDGVLFMVGVSDGRTFEELMTQHVNPFANKGDRRWIPVMIDLSSYSGEEIELKLNTYASLPGKEGDQRNDLALWGAPEIVVR